MILRSLSILSWLIDQSVDSKQRIRLIVNHHGQAGLERLVSIDLQCQFNRYFTLVRYSKVDCV